MKIVLISTLLSLSTKEYKKVNKNMDLNPPAISRGNLASVINVLRLTFSVC